MSSADRDRDKAWRERLGTTADGRERRHMLATLFAVRSFYLDMAQWSLSDPYWAQWVARCPIGKDDIKANLKQRRKVIARHQQRTRELAPLLPALIAQAEKEKRETRATLEAALVLGSGGKLIIDGLEWTLCEVRSPLTIRATRGRNIKLISVDENRAFWVWAAIETLRHSGLRIEEMLELTHLAIQPYTIKPSGETVPLVHIVPSKTDEERLIVAGPELVHVLTAILKRIRDTNQDVPLTQRWDNHEHQLSEPLPHLFVHRYHSNLVVLSGGTIQKYLNDLARRAGLHVGGRPVAFTPHDFRRLFATEAIAAGIPPHIVQVLLGHKSLATTQGYAAIYPQDVIQAHRTYIMTRRKTRPSEEYREPTPAEWAEFEAHFVQRKVSLGTRGRGYGTSCHHEHACIRCGLLRPDPAQADRFRDIIANLADRIEEAEQNRWLGEVEGLKISLAGAEDKLHQMERQLGQTGATDLGMPIFGPVAAHSVLSSPESTRRGSATP